MTKEKIQHNFFFILLGVMTVAGLVLLSPYAGMFFVSIMFAIIFKPMHLRVRHLFGGHRNTSALITTLIVMMVVLIPLGFFGFQIFEEAKDLYLLIANEDMGNGIVAKTGTALQRYAPQLAPALSEDIGQYLGKGLQWAVTNLGVIFSSVATTMVDFVLVLFTLFFLFRDEETFRKMILALSPLQDAHSAELLDRVEAAIASVTKGTILVALLQGVLTGLGFALVGMPNPVLWASIAAFAAMVPAIGTGLVIVPAVAYLALIGHMSAATILAVWGVGIVGTVDNLLRPMLIGRGIKIHPLIILFSALGGLQFFGIIGFFVGPVVLAVLFTLFEMYPKIMQSHTEV
ncbi:hypothetical protein A2524_02370 [Candidatus Wolfebacteria bacterium RIFOXYD12_FULL_48_21]|uniref:AI-2E family transporter n=1 Tax=Candidatus Wolfebacteria bacterium RIFOXYD1_FULL_48_65 TaxID=1802561 RepID=A0A1F8E1S8_9BACT|nr:MAG: hypothetical protein A2524_02370 [Candidatus Wolfebacteria bacterium RIFOXYD12_FULL_48_21]OGM94814.1 MAG: hypothetical protein A2610_04085 [Candidatus Wolfebacteria bacterium RIFOXYD1_FULL_48_65]